MQQQDETSPPIPSNYAAHPSLPFSVSAEAVKREKLISWKLLRKKYGIFIGGQHRFFGW